MKISHAFNSIPNIKIRHILQLLLTFIFFTASNPAMAAGLLVAEGGFGGKLELLKHEVDVTINNGIAVTEITQVFKNMEKRQVEALYTFPVPKGASVANFSMWINGKEMTGEVVEKQRAREIYNSYKKRRRDPGLLEQTDYKTFEMRIFPIGPEAEQKIKLAYYQELDLDHDWATYVYPLATTSRRNIDQRVKGKFALNMHVKSSIPISNMKSPSHPKDFLIINNSNNYFQASLEKQSGDLASDLVLGYQISRPQTGIDVIASNQTDEDGYFMMTLTAGKELEKSQTGSDYVFILDVSGSMANKGKLITSTKNISEFIHALGPDDRFEVITFNMQPNFLFNSLKETSTQNMQLAEMFLNSQEAKGGTLLQPAIENAYKYRSADRPLNTVILSDGMTEQKERRELIRLIKSRPDNVRVFCIGVGNEVNRSLLKQIAEEAGGLAAFVSRGDDLKRQAKAFQRKLMHPVATDMNIKLDGIEAYDIEPKSYPNLYHGMPIRIYGRYRQSGTAKITLTATINGRPIQTNAEMTFPEIDSNNPEIERMWAWHALDRLNRENEINPNQQHIDEMIRLGEAYSITSEFTSFLVLENDAEYARWKIKRRNALRIKRDRQAQQQVRQELEQIREANLQQLGPANETQNNKNKSINNKPATKQKITKAPTVKTPKNRPASRSIDLPRFSGGGAMSGPTSLLGLLLFVIFMKNRRKK